MSCPHRSAPYRLELLTLKEERHRRPPPTRYCSGTALSVFLVVVPMSGRGPLNSAALSEAAGPHSLGGFGSVLSHAVN